VLVFQIYWMRCYWLFTILSLLKFFLVSCDLGRGRVTHWKEVLIMRPKERRLSLIWLVIIFRGIFLHKLNVKGIITSVFKCLLCAQYFLWICISYGLTLFFFVSGEWKELEFKEYNYSAKGQPLEGGSLHPLLKARRYTFYFPQLHCNSNSIRFLD